jgi:5-methylcytosine-specific restriction endonuclease McrBC regulatory subunit McrC
MAKLIVLSFNDLIKDGLEKSYISKTKDITGIKGRLCLGDTIKSIFIKLTVSSAIN